MSKNDKLKFSKGQFYPLHFNAHKGFFSQIDKLVVEYLYGDFGENRRGRPIGQNFLIRVNVTPG